MFGLSGSYLLLFPFSSTVFQSVRLFVVGISFPECVHLRGKITESVCDIRDSVCNATWRNVVSFGSILQQSFAFHVQTQQTWRLSICVLLSGSHAENNDRNSSSLALGLPLQNTNTRNSNILKDKNSRCPFSAKSTAYPPGFVIFSHLSLNGDQRFVKTCGSDFYERRRIVVLSLFPLSGYPYSCVKQTPVCWVITSHFRVVCSFITKHWFVPSRTQH